CGLPGVPEASPPHPPLLQGAPDLQQNTHTHTHTTTQHTRPQRNTHTPTHTHTHTHTHAHTHTHTHIHTQPHLSHKMTCMAQHLQFIHTHTHTLTHTYTHRHTHTHSCLNYSLLYLLLYLPHLSCPSACQPVTLGLMLSRA